MKYYIIYKTTNLIDKKYYIGKHKTENINDDYLGSGKILKEAIKKYGKHNFKKEILFIFNDEISMNKKEKELVDDNFIKKEDNYNITVGGDGGFHHINNTNVNKQKYRKKALETMQNFPDDLKEKINKKKANKGRNNGMYGSSRYKELNPMWGKNHTEDSKKIQSEKRKKWFENNESYLKGKPCPEKTKQILAEKNSKEYTLLSPNNEILKIKNLTKFAKENNLSINCLQQVVSGRNKSHKGWKKYE